MALFVASATKPPEDEDEDETRKGLLQSILGALSMGWKGGGGIDQSPKRLIKAFHCWEASWEDGSPNPLGKVKQATKSASPTNMLSSASTRIVAAEMRRVPPVAEGGEETEICFIR